MEYGLGVAHNFLTLLLTALKINGDGASTDPPGELDVPREGFCGWSGHSDAWQGGAPSPGAGLDELGERPRVQTLNVWLMAYKE